MFTPGFAGEGFVALAGRGYAVAGCAPGIAHPAGQHTFFGAAHIPVEKTSLDRKYQIYVLTIWSHSCSNRSARLRS